MPDRIVRLVEDRLPRPEAYPTGARGPALSARLGLLAGTAFAVCFVTGLASHALQHREPVVLPPLPTWGYAVTQGIHVTTGIAAIPLLAVKIWSVAPRFWARPILGGPVRGLERLSVLVLVASAVLEPVSGLLNVAEAYGWIGFSFPAIHYALAWVAVGAILVHVAVHLPRLAELLRTRLDADPDGLGRRDVWRLALLSAGVVAVVTAGDKLPWLRSVGVLSQRSGRGPQDLPVNKSARAAHIAPPGSDWRLTVVTAEGERTWSLADLERMPQARARLPIACVEGWNVWADWEGVRLSDLTGPAELVRVASPDRGGYGSSLVDRAALDRDDTLLALRVNGAPLDLDHGAPARLIAAGRPGAMQTKWVDRLEVRS